MHTDLVQRVLETYYQARVFFDGLAGDHGTTTDRGVRRVTVNRIGTSEHPDHVLHQVDVVTANMESAHAALAFAHFRTELDAQIRVHVSPFLETLAEALPVARAPFGGLSLVHQQPLPNLDHTGNDVAPTHRLMLAVNGVTLQNGDQPDQHHLVWPGLLHFLEAVHPLPTLLIENHITQYGRGGVMAASHDDAERIWCAAERRVGHTTSGLKQGHLKRR